MSEQVSENNVVSLPIKTINESRAVAAFLRRVGAEIRNIRKAVVIDKSDKYPRDVCTISFEDDGTVKYSNKEYAPTPEEAEAIKQEFASITFPSVRRLPSVITPPKMIRDAVPENVFVFRGRDGLISLVQVRVDHVNGIDKNYVPWTYWSDDEWRAMEPEGKLPLFNEEKLKDASTVFIHEGAKAARHVQWMVEARTADAKKALAEHPWGEELAHAAHVGWIGGALNPHRTDWSTINKSGITRAYIVADNDAPGREAAGKISQSLRMPTHLVQFDNRFPSGFDLADRFPAELFADGLYVGPPMSNLTHDITWATDLVKSKSGKGRPSIKVRPHFFRSVSFITRTSQFAFHDDPRTLLSAKQFDDLMASRSHTNNLSRYVVPVFQGMTTKVCYRPDLPSGRIEVHGEATVNTFLPARIKSVSGPVEPFTEFLEYLIPDTDDRRQIERWLATLIAQPETRMSYAVLLISEKQGVGKTTLAEEILRPLVGPHNVSIPSEQQVVESQFNSWCARVRLIIVNEIYSGHGWKANKKLKPLLTDKTVEVNEKHQQVYSIENWAHMLACSNSMRALKLEEDDRRWFVPTVTEVAWPRERFSVLRAYLANGGLRHILHWAENYGDYVLPGERAPMSTRKRSIIEDSRSLSMTAAIELAQEVCDLDARGKELIAFKGSSIDAWASRMAGGAKVTDRPVEIRRAMCDAGMAQLEDRIRFAGRKEYVLINPALAAKVNLLAGDERRTVIEGALTDPNNVIPEGM